MFHSFVRKPSAWSNRRWLALALLAYVGCCFLLTHIDIRGTSFNYRRFPSGLRYADKLFHITAYGGLSFLLLLTGAMSGSRGGPHQRRLGMGHRLLFASVAAVYGALDEITQPYFGRNLELLDYLANLVGIASGQVAFAFFENTRRVIWLRYIRLRRRRATALRRPTT